MDLDPNGPIALGKELYIGMINFGKRYELL
jgi:hypothetical protein